MAELTGGFRSAFGLGWRRTIGGIVPPVAPVFTAYANETETTALAATFTAPPTARRQRSIDTCIKRLKAAGVWQKATALYLVGADEQASGKNWRTPGTYDLVKNGTPTFTANDGWQAVAAGDFLNTGLPLNALARDDVGHYVWSKTGTQSGNSEYGAVDASSNGISLAARNTGDAVQGRAQSANSATITANTQSDGLGLTGISRTVAANVICHRNGVAKPAATLASVVPGAQPIYLLTVNVNGVAGGVSVRKQSAWYFGQALTEAQARALTGAIGTYLDAVEFGEMDVTATGIGPATVTADCIAYGTTPQSIAFALQAARAGRTVAVVGGFRDRHIGGMSAGGLGYTDFDNRAGLGGLARRVITRMNAMAARADTLFTFTPRNFSRAMRELLDPAKNGGFTIPIYWSDGVAAVAKTGAAITSLTTVDGRVFQGLQFFDGSYEGDLLIKAGVSYKLGREAAGTGTEALNGYNGVNGGPTFQLRTAGNAGVAYVDPWVTPGVPASGRLPQVHGTYSTFTPALHDQPALGTADERTQAYNFRLTMTADARKRVPLPLTPPPGFDIAQYEVLLRYLAANPTVPFSQLFNIDALYEGTLDINNGEAFTTDWIGANHAYPLASYADRKAIWDAHWNWIRGLFYVLQVRPDTRVPASLQTTALTYGWCQDHYLAPHPDDEMHEMPQLYVREGVRMVAPVVMTGNHLTQADGQVPTLGVKTVSVASYTMDSHYMQRLAYEYAAGQWTVWCEGNLAAAAGSANLLSPLPYEICVPNPAECTNLSVGFAVSATHVAFGSIRMEFTAMQIGQSMGQAAALAISGATTIQAVDYPTLRTALLASASLPGEVAPVLPQVT